jgi:hypothetical protein
MYCVKIILIAVPIAYQIIFNYYDLLNFCNLYKFLNLSNPKRTLSDLQL